MGTDRANDRRSGPPAGIPPWGAPPMFDAAVAFLLFMVPPFLVLGYLQPGADLTEQVVDGSLGLLSGVVAVSAYAVLRRRALPARLAPARALATYGVFMVFWLPAAMILYPYLLDVLGYEFTAQKPLQYFSAENRDFWFWLVIFVSCVGAPVGEELFFRGFLFTAVAEVVSPAAAVVLTAILFGAVHEPAVAVPVMGLGLLFGYLRDKTGGVASSILVHIVHNTWTVAVVLCWPQAIELVYDK